MAPEARPGAQAKDEAIRATDMDAATARASAARVGYVDDPFAAMLLSGDDDLRRAPLINMGTHHRTFAIDTIVSSFLEAPFRGSAASPRNVVSLGSGSDSRFWRLRKRWEKDNATSAWPVRRWVEADFAETAERKALQIARHDELKRWCDVGTPTSDQPGTTREAAPKVDGVAFTSPLLTLLSADLRSDPQQQSLVEALRQICPPEEPLLVLAELVFVYMPPTSTRRLLHLLAKTWHSGVAFALYELLFTGDPFGATMVRNLKARNLSLAGLAANPSVDSQRKRLIDAGCTTSWATDMKRMRRQGLPAEETRRIARIELLDEVEELELILEHYCLAFGVRPAHGDEPCWHNMTQDPTRPRGRD